MGKDLKGKEIGKGIHQKKNGRYEARYIDRFGKRVSIYATSKTEIKQKLAQALKENEEKISIKKRMTVDEWYKEWMEVYKAPLIRPNTKRHYVHIFKSHILPELGAMYMDEVKQIHAKSLINKLDAKGYQYETQNKVRILITDMFNYAIENDYALKNPGKGLRLLKSKPNERIVLSVEDQEDFFECAAGTFYYNLFVVAVNTGLRAGEICALTEKDIDFEERTISVTKTLLYQKLEGDDGKEYHIGPPKTDTSVRKVPFTKECETALRKQIRLKKFLANKYKRTGEFADLLFVTKFNTPICSVVLNDAIKRIIDESNLHRDEIDLMPKFSAHTFRHTFATRCIEAGIQPKVLQKYLGHATLEMTMDLYVHVTEDYMQEEIQKLEELQSSKQGISRNCIRVVS